MRGGLKESGPLSSLVTLLPSKLSYLGTKTAHCYFMDAAFFICYGLVKCIFLERYTQALRAYLMTIVNIQFHFYLYQERDRQTKGENH